MNQLALPLLERVLIHEAREQGRAAAEACADKAERTTAFDTDKARTFVMGHLAAHGPSWGEDIVDAAKSSSRNDLQAHDGRAWGSVFSTLARQNKIRCLRADGIRRHGNGCSGAKLWALVL